MRISDWSSDVCSSDLLDAMPAFADVRRGNLRLLLSGPASSAGRPMSDGATPGPGGWNRLHLLVDDIASEVSSLRDAGVSFRNDVVTGPRSEEHTSELQSLMRIS